MIETAIITTTINIPFFLNKILQNVLKEKKNKKIIIVIGDKKHQRKLISFAKKSKKYKTNLFKYLDQDKFFKEFSKLYKMFHIMMLLENF